MGMAILGAGLMAFGVLLGYLIAYAMFNRVMQAGEDAFPSITVPDHPPE